MTDKTFKCDGCLKECENCEVKIGVKFHSQEESGAWIQWKVCEKCYDDAIRCMMNDSSCDFVTLKAIIDAQPIP